MRATVVTASGLNLTALVAAFGGTGIDDVWVCGGPAGDRFMVEPRPDLVFCVLNPDEGRSVSTTNGFTNQDVMLRASQCAEDGLPTMLIAPPALQVPAQGPWAAVAPYRLDQDQELADSVSVFVASVRPARSTEQPPVAAEAAAAGPQQDLTENAVREGQETEARTHRDDYPQVAAWLRRAPSTHGLVQLLDAKREPGAEGPTNEDRILRHLELLARVVDGAQPKGLPQFLSSRFRDANEANMWSARLELLCAANLAFNQVPFEFGGTGEPDLTWNPGTASQGWMEIHRGAFSPFDAFRADLDRELAAKDATLEVRVAEWPSEVPDRNAVLTRIASAASAAAKTGIEQRVSMPEVGAGATAVVRCGQPMEPLGRVSVHHSGLTPSANYLSSLAERLAGKVDEKAGQARKGSWSPRTVVLIDISTAHLTQLLGHDGLAEWLNSVPLDWEDLPFVGVAVCFSHLHSPFLWGACRYKEGLDASTRSQLESVLSLMGLQGTP